MAFIPVNPRIRAFEVRYALLRNFIKKRIFSIREYDHKKVDKILFEIQREIARVRKFSLRWADQNLTWVYNQGYTKAKKKMIKEGIKPPGKNTIKHGRKQEIINRFKIITGQMTDSIYKGAVNYFEVLKKAEVEIQTKMQFKMEDTEVTKRIDNVINDALEERYRKVELADGEETIRIAISTTDEARDEIVKVLKKAYGKIDFVEVNGRNYNVKKYAKMIARTEMRKGQTQSVLDVCEQFDNDLVQVSQHGDSCPICDPYQGQIYSLSGQSKEYPALDIEIPIHPNCEHNLDPVSSYGIAVMKRRGTLPTQTKNKPTVPQRRQELRKAG